MRVKKRAKVRFAMEAHTHEIPEPEGPPVMPYSEHVTRVDQRLLNIKDWLLTLQQPEHLHKSFVYNGNTVEEGLPQRTQADHLEGEVGLHIHSICAFCDSPSALLFLSLSLLFPIDPLLFI